MKADRIENLVTLFVPLAIKIPIDRAWKACYTSLILETFSGGKLLMAMKNTTYFRTRTGAPIGLTVQGRSLPES